MATFLTSPIPSLTLPLASFSSSFMDRTRPSLLNPVCLPPPTHLGRLRSACLVRSGFHPGFFPDPDGLESLGKLECLYRRAEGVLYTIADAAVSNSEIVGNTTDATTKQKGDWLSGITYSMETVLKVLKNGLSAMHIPYAYGFAIILLTILVKAATFPLAKKQVESAMAMRSLQPQIKAIQQHYVGDQERIQLETARLYKLAGINPLAGCLPTLATIPVWIGLYRALSNVADEGLLTEGFFWIPSLAGPTTIAARQNGSGISWLFPFVVRAAMIPLSPSLTLFFCNLDGHPPLGWSDTFAYLVLPVSLIVLQYISIQIMQSSQRDDPNMKSSQAITNFLPLMIGYFSLSVPSGLSLYWLTNNILSSVQQVWLQKLGGAKIPVDLLNEDIIVKEPPPISKSASNSSSTLPTQPKQEEKLTPEGLRPGERFKQIKAQEALRRQPKEEEKRKAEETKVHGSQNGGLGEGAKSSEGVNGSTVADADTVDEKYVTTTCDPSASISSIERTDGPAYSEVFGSDEQQSHGEREQIKVKNETAKI